MSGVMGFLTGVVLPLGLMAALIPPAIRQLRGPTHPSRLLAENLGAGFVLLVCALMISMPGWMQILWWVVLAVVIAGVVVTTRRMLREAETDAARAGDTAPAEHTSSAEHSASVGPSEQLRPMSRGELTFNGALWAVMITAALLGG